MAELKIIRMSDIRPEPVEWLWEPYIPYGAITLIQGDGGMGKTTVSLAITAAVTKGDALPGGSSIIPSHVIIQNAEDSYAQTIRPRLEQLGADCDMIHLIDEEEQALSFSDERIEQTIIETGARLFILDPAQAYFGRANMNSAGGVRPLMKRLGTVATRHRCAFLLVGHFNKKASKAQYAGLGSIDIFAAARSALMVGGTHMDESIRAIVHSKSNLAPAGKSQAFGFDPVDGFTWMGDCDVTIDEIMGKKPKPKSQFSKARCFLEQVLAREPVLAVVIMEMAEEEEISTKTLNRAKEALGVMSIKRGVQWYWVLPLDVECTEVNQDGQRSHHSQIHYLEDGQTAFMTNMATLTTLPEHIEQEAI